MITTKVKTSFNGLVWFHEKYKNALEEGRGVIVEYRKKYMTLTKEDLPNLKQSDTSFRERFGPQRGQMYYLYGVKFKPDEMQSQSKERTRRNAGELISQCSECNNVEVVTGLNKSQWQGSIVEFPHLPRTVCLSCKNKKK